MRYGLKDHDFTQWEGPHFPGQSTVLDEEALLALVLPRYKIPAPAECRFFSRGDGDVYRVHTPEAYYYLKVYRPPRTKASSESEARFVDALANAGQPVVRPVPRVDGWFASVVEASEGARPMLLFEAAPPPFPRELHENLLSKVGEAVAHMHSTADNFEDDFGISPMYQEKFIGEHLSYSARFLSKADMKYLAGIADALQTKLNALPRTAPDFGLCHADLVNSNLRLTEDGGVTLFDFGNVLQTWRALDLAVVYWSNRKRIQEDKGLWQAFLEGYRSIRPLPDQFEQVFPLMLVLRQISFLGGNCATLPLRLGTEPFENGFVPEILEHLRNFVDMARL